MAMNVKLKTVHVHIRLLMANLVTNKYYHFVIYVQHDEHESMLMLGDLGRVPHSTLRLLLVSSEQGSNQITFLGQKGHFFQGHVGHWIKQSKPGMQTFRMQQR